MGVQPRPRAASPAAVHVGRWGVLVLVGGITTLGLLLRLPSFDDSLFGDELSTYYIVTGHGLGRIIHLLHGHSVDLNPPLSFVLAWAAERLAGPPQSLRLTSLVAGTAAIPLTYVLGLWTVGRRAALVGAALVALSPILIFYSTEARPYALALVLILLSTLALLRALHTGRSRWWVAYAACSCAAIYTQFIPVFWLVPQFVWAFWTQPTARRALLAANAAAAIAFVPWLPAVLDQTGSPGLAIIGAVNPFGLHSVRIDLGRASVGHPYTSLASLPGHAALAMAAAGLATGFLGAILKGRAALLRRPPAESVLVFVLAFVPPVAVALYSSIDYSIWETRNLIHSWPAFALAVGVLVTSAGGVLRVAAVGLVVGALAIGAARMLDSDFQRPDYNAAASFIERSGGPDAPVVEIPIPAPGPLGPVGDVALNRFGQSTAEHRPVLRLAAPTLGAALRARPYEPLPQPSARAVAGKAARLARGGTIFAVAKSDFFLEALIRDSFAKALPDGFSLVATRTVPGFFDVSVYVFRDRKGR